MAQAQSIDLVQPCLNPRWQKFLQQKVNSFIKWDLVRFFHDNPYTVDTSQNIARVIGRDDGIITRELDGLAKDGLLQRDEKGSQVVYRLTDNAETQMLIREFVTACHNRDFRVEVIHHVIHKMGFQPQRDA